MTPNKHLLCVFIVINDVEFVNEDQWVVRAIETKMATARTNKFFI